MCKVLKLQISVQVNDGLVERSKHVAEVFKCTLCAQLLCTNAQWDEQHERIAQGHDTPQSAFGQIQQGEEREIQRMREGKLWNFLNVKLHEELTR